MKIKEIGEKIGNIDIKAPSKNTQGKLYIVFIMLYKVAFVLAIAQGFYLLWFSLFREYNEEFAAAAGLIVGVPIAHFAILFAIKVYKKKVSELENNKG